MVPPSQHYYPSPSKIEGHKRITPVQDELYNTQSQITVRKGLGNGKYRKYSRESKDQLSTYNRKIQGEIKAPEIPKDKK